VWLTSSNSDEFDDNMIDLLRRNFLSPEFRMKLQKEVLLFLKVWYLNFHTTQARSKKALMRKISSIRVAVFIKLRLVTDTDRHRTTAGTALA